MIMLFAGKSQDRGPRRSQCRPDGRPSGRRAAHESARGTVIDGSGRFYGRRRYQAGLRPSTTKRMAFSPALAQLGRCTVWHRTASIVERPGEGCQGRLPHLLLTLDLPCANSWLEVRCGHGGPFLGRASVVSGARWVGVGEPVPSVVALGVTRATIIQCTWRGAASSIGRAADS
mgnify:CR=1 FL=1